MEYRLETNLRVEGAYCFLMVDLKRKISPAITRSAHSARRFSCFRQFAGNFISFCQSGFVYYDLFNDILVFLIFLQILMFLSFDRLKEPQQQIPSSYDQIEAENERQPLLT